MSTYTQILYQIVYSTKYREPSLTKDNRDLLFGYLVGVLENNNCHPYRVGGIYDHIHVVTHLHPSVCLADLVKDLKLSATDFIKENGLFKAFHGWQDGYAAFTYSIKAKENLVNYVMNQEKHHYNRSFVRELKDLLAEHEIPYDEKYLV